MTSPRKEIREGLAGLVEPRRSAERAEIERRACALARSSVFGELECRLYSLLIEDPPLSPL